MTKTRSAAASACRGGHVTVNGKAAKPSSAVRVGDVVEARLHQRDRILEVVAVIIKRVGASVAIECYIDNSLPEPERHRSQPVFEREPGAGRPTKRDRRRLDKLRGRTRNSDRHP